MSKTSLENWEKLFQEIQAIMNAFEIAHKVLQISHRYPRDVCLAFPFQGFGQEGEVVMTASPSYPKLVQDISALGADLVMDRLGVHTCSLPPYSKVIQYSEKRLFNDTYKLLK